MNIAIKPPFRLALKSLIFLRLLSVSQFSQINQTLSRGRKCCIFGIFCNSLSLSFLVSIPHCLEIENFAFVFSNLTISNLQFSVPKFSGINSTLCRDRKCCIVFSICGEFGALWNVFRMLLHFSNVPSNGHRVANCRCLSTFCNVSLFVLQEQRSM